jgi:hypothetical protein
MASSLLFFLPSIVDEFKGDSGGGGGGGGDSGGNNSDPPDYQESLDAVNRQRDEGQKAVNQLAENFKAHNEGLVKRIAKTEETAVAQLNKQKEVFKAKTVDVKDIEMPGIDPNVLLYGGLAFGAMALLIVMK